MFSTISAPGVWLAGLGLGPSYHHQVAVMGCGGRWATYWERLDEWHSRQKVVWRRLGVSQNAELKANFPSVLECDFTLCDMVEQLERRRRRRVTPLSPTLWDAAVILTKAGRQACLTDTDFVFHEVDAGQSTFQYHNQVPTGREEH